LPFLTFLLISLSISTYCKGEMLPWQTAFGTSYDVVKATELRQQWRSRNFSQLPSIEVLSDEVLGTANGAYAIALKEIYLGLAEYQ
jgi:predicted PhzF superfamily epimerase YddE/YHI9